MASKRKKDEIEEMTSRERKKLKVADARTIAVQPAASNSDSVGVQSSGKALAGPSSTTIRFDCKHPLLAVSLLDMNLKPSYAGITRVNRRGEIYRSTCFHSSLFYAIHLQTLGSSIRD